MNLRNPWFVTGAALALTAAALGTAQAGNADVPSAQYFSVHMTPMQFLKYVGSDPNAVLLIDDITYSGLMDPCLASRRCAYFAVGDETDPNDPPPPPNALFVVAAGVDFAMGLAEISTAGGTTTVQEFDRMSHSTHAELIIAEPQTIIVPPVPPEPDGVVNWSVLDDPPPPPPPPPPPGPPDYDPVPELETDVSDLALSTWAVQTSQSRHYQSPQVIQFGNSVAFFVAPTLYGSPVAYVKGRIATTPDAPVENLTDVVLSQQP